jgi:hypothetical protein
MRRQTVAAGVIAGIVVACSGPGLETIGGMMNDAGHGIAGAGDMLDAAGGEMNRAGEAGISGYASAMLGVAGQMLSDAGGAIVEAGSSLASAGHSGEGGKAQESSSDGLPRAHWVMRDKNGMAVQAHVYPGYSNAHPKFDKAGPECVSVAYYGSRMINLGYTLATGAIARSSECPYGLQDAASWKDSSNAYFLDMACSGAAYFVGPSVISIAGSVYYADGAANLTNVTTYYHWDEGMAACKAINNPSGTSFWAWKSLPTDVRDLLPNAPYTLELVY